MVDDRATRVGVGRGQSASVTARFDERQRRGAVFDDGVDRRRAGTLGIEEQLRTAGGQETLVDHRADIESRAGVIQEAARGQRERGVYAERDAGDCDIVARLQAVDCRVRRDARRHRRIGDIDVVRRDIRRSQHSGGIRGRAGRTHRGDTEPGDVGRPVLQPDGGPATDKTVREAPARRSGRCAADGGKMDAGAAAGLAGGGRREVDRSIGRTGQPAERKVGGVDAGAAQNRVDGRGALGEGDGAHGLSCRSLRTTTELDDAPAEGDRGGVVDAIVRIIGAGGVIEIKAAGVIDSDGRRRGERAVVAQQDVAAVDDRRARVGVVRIEAQVVRAGAS